MKVINLIEMLETFDENAEIFALDINEDKLYEISCVVKTEGKTVSENILAIGFEKDYEKEIGK